MTSNESSLGYNSGHKVESEVVMVSSARRIIFCLLLIFSLVVCASSQTNSEKSATASVSGKVTVKNKGVAGIVLVAEEQNFSASITPTYRGVTDEAGNFRITNLAAGTYLIRPIATSLAFEDESPTESFSVNEGENVENVNFSMIPGAVITGRITDVDGKPLIEQRVSVLAIGATGPRGLYLSELLTDDRGIYRAFGLHAGKYKVSVGQNESLPLTGDVGPYYRQTFYPSVTDVEKAAVIDVKEGSEATNVDIVVGRPGSMYKVTGRVLDAETGKPLRNINYGVYQGRPDHGGGSSAIGRNFTNANGEFKLESVRPGNYVVFIAPNDGDVRGDSGTFEVVDRDVNDLVINAVKGASLSGVVVFEGAQDSPKPDTLFVSALTENGGPYFANPTQGVNADGSFRIRGLQKGRIRFNLSPFTRNDLKPMDIVRVERDGVPQTTGLIVKDGEQVTGLRLIVKYLTGAIHGEIKVEDGESLAKLRLSMWLNALDTNRTWFQSPRNSRPQLDSHQRFTVEGLAAGTYEVGVAVYEPGRFETNRVYTQQVTVTDNAVSEVTITIKAKP